MFDRSSLLHLWRVAALAFVVCGCSQGAGEPCQVHADCDSGLVCNARGGSRGTCVTQQEAAEGADQSPADDEDAGS